MEQLFQEYGTIILGALFLMNEALTVFKVITQNSLVKMFSSLKIGTDLKVDVFTNLSSQVLTLASKMKNIEGLENKLEDVNTLISTANDKIEEFTNLKNEIIELQGTFNKLITQSKDTLDVAMKSVNLENYMTELIDHFATIEKTVIDIKTRLGM